LDVDSVEVLCAHPDYCAFVKKSQPRTALSHFLLRAG
jgi:hypothetical protein